MTTKAIDEVLSRWFRDETFREQLRNDPQKALADYDLTPEQRAKLSNLKKQTEAGKQAYSA